MALEGGETKLGVKFPTYVRNAVVLGDRVFCDQSVNLNGTFLIATFVYGTCY